ncbi:MAG: DegT/DnrJ/EryC1/StrS family aminotransferase [Chloroflexi bacterium]|nr:DegT/DnrJ/EryC1/StrS family aminotransferase [Chloroflexota bacterium]
MPLCDPPDISAALRLHYGRDPIFTASGRAGLALILQYLKLRYQDEVWITTTLGWRDRRITPCVTATLAHYCRFASHPGPRTAAALVIHDYGVVHPDLEIIRDVCQRHGWPLIEDAAHALASSDRNGRALGSTGDFAFASLLKFFPVTKGGFVLGLSSNTEQDQEAKRYAACWWSQLTEITQVRLHNWHRLDAMAHRAGGAAALPLAGGSCPSLYLLRTVRQSATMQALHRRGIESGPPFYAGLVFLPCHQQVSEQWLERIEEALEEAHPLSSTPEETRCKACRYTAPRSG